GRERRSPVGRGTARPRRGAAAATFRLSSRRVPGRPRTCFPSAGPSARRARIIMSKNLYVGNLPFSTTADDLREAFGQFGAVTRAQVVEDRETGRSRGFGFVEMAEGGDEAIANLNGALFQGRTLTVNEAKPREERPARQGGGNRERSG